MGALKKTPFQLKKEAEEEKRLKAEAEAAAALAEYESSFGQDSASSFYASRTSAPAFVKSGSHSNPGSVKKDFAYTPAPVPSPPVARAGLYSEGNAVQPPLPRQGFGQKKAFTIQLNRSKPSASPSAYNVPSIPGLNYQGNSAIQSQSLPGVTSHPSLERALPFPSHITYILGNSWLAIN